MEYDGSLNQESPTNSSSQTQAVYASAAPEEEVDATSLHQQIQGLVSEGQEVFVLDEETGEYQKCIYVPQTEEGGGRTEEEEAPKEENGGAEEVTQEQEQIQLAISDPAVLAALSSENGTVNLESLLASGAINAETFSALTGQTVSIVQEEEEEAATPAAEEEESVQFQVVEEEEEEKEQEYHVLPASTTNDENEVPAAQQPLYVVQCPKCAQNFKQEDFETHYSEAHGGGGSDAGVVDGGGATTSDGGKTCSICRKQLTRKDYLTHFKEAHSDVRLGCPKCPQTYHSPDLLNVHYKHFHLGNKSSNKASEGSSSEYSLQEDGRATLKNVRLLIQCRVCGTAVEGALDEHMEEFHPEHASFGIPYQQQQEQEQQSRRQSHPNVPRPRNLLPLPASFQGSAGGGGELPPPPLRQPIHCQVCLKDYSTQREFANHRRRKDFCRPPIVESPPTKKRRVGILRKRSL